MISTESYRKEKIIMSIETGKVYTKMIGFAPYPKYNMGQKVSTPDFKLGVIKAVSHSYYGPIYTVTNLGPNDERDYTEEQLKPADGPFDGILRNYLQEKSLAEMEIQKLTKRMHEYSMAKKFTAVANLATSINTKAVKLGKLEGFISYLQFSKQRIKV